MHPELRFWRVCRYLAKITRPSHAHQVQGCAGAKRKHLLGEGRGFEISQVSWPGRIHCMRSIGKAEKALELMVTRAGTRVAFGKPIAKLGKNVEVISRARIEINAMR